MVIIEERSLFSACGKALAASQSSPRLARNAHEGRTHLTNIADAVAAGRISTIVACERCGSASSRGESAYEAALGSRIAFAHTPPMIEQYQ